MANARVSQNQHLHGDCKSNRSGNVSQRDGSSIIASLRELLNAVDAVLADWYSGDLLVSAEDARNLYGARDKAAAIIGRAGESSLPSAHIV